MSIREFVDSVYEREFKKRYAKLQGKNKPANGDASPEKYPIGFCHWIRDQVYNVIRAHQKNRKLKGLQALREFRKRGGIFKPVKGIQHKKYFQNGFQAGAYWIDVANDTVDQSKPKIAHSWLAESEFENADDPTHCAEVIESYWQHDVYPNIYFPQLAPLFPFLHTNSNGEITIAPSLESMIGRAMLSSLKTTEDFLFSSRFSDKRLPRGYTDLIGKHFHFTEEEPSRSFHRTGVSREELGEVFAQQRESLEDGSFKEDMLEAFKTVDTFNELELKLRDRIAKKLQTANM